MRICIPSEERQGTGGQVAEHFGHAESFAVLDTATGRLELVENSVSDAGPGGCRTVRQIRELAVEAVVCRRMGVNAIELLRKAGIAVFEAMATTVEDAATQAMAGELIPLEQPATRAAEGCVCSGHQRHRAGGRGGDCHGSGGGCARQRYRGRGL